MFSALNDVRTSQNAGPTVTFMSRKKNIEKGRK
jgi:hypothetical protein